MENNYIQDWNNSIEKNRNIQNKIAQKFGCDYDSIHKSTSFNKILLEIAKNESEKYALKGLIFDEKTYFEDLDEYIKGINSSFALTDAYQNLKESISELNYQTRKKYYYEYTTKTSEELENLRQKELKYYDFLIGNLEIYEKQGKFTKGNQSIDFKEILNRKSATIRCNDYIPFDTAYDLGVTYYCNIGNSTKTQSEQLYNQVMEYLNEERANLEKMTLDDYRAHKISKMKLTKDEVVKIKKDLNLPLLPEEMIKPEKIEYLIENEEIPIEDLEIIEDKKIDVFQTTAKEHLVEKMNKGTLALPKEFQDAILMYLDNMFVVDLSKEKYTAGQKEKENYIVAALESLHGSIWVTENDELIEIEYSISRESSDIYKVVLRAGNKMQIQFSYDERKTDLGAKIDVTQCNYPNKEPKLGINFIEYFAYALGDGRLYATGSTSKSPALYDELGNEVNSHKESTGTFNCDSYEALKIITNDSLELTNGNNKTI